MNRSRPEQRVLHVMARGGRIIHARESAWVTEITCFTHDRAVLSDCTMKVFTRLRRTRLIASSGGWPCRISRRDPGAVRAD